MSSGYEEQELTAIGAALDANPDATSSEVFQATRPYDERAIASVAASRALAGGGGSMPAVAANLALDANLDIHASGDYPILWDNLVDNQWDYNSIGAIPDGLGLDFEFDGSSSQITTLEAGIWTFAGAIVFDTPDANIRGRLTLPFSGQGLPFGPIFAGGPIACQGLNLPAGATSAMTVAVLADASANPYHMRADLMIVRLG